MSSNPPVYDQVAALMLYQLSSSDDAGVAGYWAGYLPSSAAGFGATVTLSQVWQDIGGVYLFLNQTPTDFAAFLPVLQSYLQVVSPNGLVRMLWLANPNDASTAWISQLLLAQGHAGSPATWTVPRQALFPLGGYAIQINAGASLQQADSLGSGITVASSSCIFVSPGGSFAPSSNTFWLPLAGGSVGAWAGSMPVSSQNGVDGFQSLLVQLRYAAPATDDPTDNNVQPIAMPVLLQGQSQTTFSLSFDPLNPLVPARTRLSFFPATGTMPAFDATMVTVLGYGTTLQPISASAPLWPARFVFCFSPQFSAGGSAYNNYYLAPDGAFELATKTPSQVLAKAENEAVVDRVTLGLSGLEYVGLATTTGTIVFFQAGNAAFAPNVRVSATGPLEQADAPLLTAIATTAYLTFLASTPTATGLTYFAQPRQAPLYVAGTDLGTGFMDFHEMAAATLPAYSPASGVPVVVPMGMYSGIDPTLSRFARALELAALAPARRLAVGLPAEVSLSEDDAPTYAVTPQGLVAQLSNDSSQLAAVIVANRANSPALSFAPVLPAFQAALQSNELFFVVSNVETFFQSTSTSYQLTTASLQLLPSEGVPQSVVASLNTLLAGMTPPYPVFHTETAFIQAIQTTAGTYLSEILPVAGLLKVSLDGWVFQLSPRSWRPAPGKPTVMIFKYCSRNLEDMATDASAWGWPEAAQDGTASLVPTQKLLQTTFLAAAQAAPGTPYARFYNEVVRNPQWNGVLFLNAPVSISELPAELQFATAGIDAKQFYAHHVGFSVTPFDASSAVITLGQTAVFALIDYQDPTDLFLASTVPLAFKTLVFTARFANAALADFAARVELMVNQLFGAQLTMQLPEHGNNLVLNGGYQRQNGVPAYAFTLEGKNLYMAARSGVASVEVLGVGIQTTSSTQAAGSISVNFILSGNLRMIELPGFDPFSYGQETYYPENTEPADGYLRFGSLTVNMSFSMATPALQTFTSNEGGLSFDLGNSIARPLSLTQNFPVRLSALISSPNLAADDDPPTGQRPEDLGYTSIAAPMEQSLLSPPWFGLVYALDLGTLGALAGSVGISLSLLVAWSTGVSDEQRPVFLGLQFPNASSLGLSLPIQGVLRLGFRSFQFMASGDDTKRSYMLRLHRLALSILGWSFPPGTTDMFLFGNDTGDPKAALGWYAAYSGPDEKDDSQASRRELRRASAASPKRRLQSGRRTLPPGTGV